MSELKTATLDWKDSTTPVSTIYGDVYFSTDDGVAETEYVFLQQNNLAQRFSQLPDSPKTLFTIAETGFGTGLNFTLCLKLWRQYAPRQARLRFISFEKHPIQLSDLEKAYQERPALQEVASQWQQSYPPLFPGLYHCDIGDREALVLFFGDVIAGLDELVDTLHPDHQHREGWIDAWFLDGFAPSKNPDMWSSELFQRMARLSHTSTTFATFTAAGDVRRGLTAVGFVARKVKGFGKKREMLAGQFLQSTAVRHDARPPQGHKATWYLSPPHEAAPSSVAVVGAGIAGANIAHALAKRGIKVSVFEANDSPALAASGNLQGIIYGKLSHQDSTLGRFICSSLSYAQNFYRLMFEHRTLTAQKDGDLCGVLMLEGEKSRLPIATAFQDSSHFISPLTKEDASKQVGLTTTEGGLFLHNAGWLHPAAVCEGLLKHPNIECFYNHRIDDLVQNAYGWQIGDKTFDAVVLTTGKDKHTLCSHLPIKRIRGQVTHIETTQPLDNLKAVVCGRGYIAPHREGQHCIGASFNLKDDNVELTDEDQTENINNLLWAFPELDRNSLEPGALNGRVAFRATTPDYLPLVGPLPDVNELLTHFQALSKNANKNIYVASKDIKGLFLLGGLGSKGLAYAPLCAEHLAAKIVGEASTLPLSQHISLHPRRFLVRNIIRNIAQNFDED